MPRIAFTPAVVLAAAAGLLVGGLGVATSAALTTDAAPAAPACERVELQVTHRTAVPAGILAGEVLEVSTAHGDATILTSLPHGTTTVEPMTTSVCLDDGEGWIVLRDGERYAVAFDALGADATLVLSDERAVEAIYDGPAEIHVSRAGDRVEVTIVDVVAP